MPIPQSAYPLEWPMGWARTAHIDREIAKFYSTSRLSNPDASYRLKSAKSMDSATIALISQLRKLQNGYGVVVISSNVELRRDGLPYSNRKPPEDPGAAVYFKLHGKDVSLACDKWLRVEDNIYAIAKHIEALRGQERWGVGSIERAFSGYMRLPAPGTTAAATWWNVLGCAHDAPFAVVKDAYLAKANLLHPDRQGGSHDAMVTLNAAWDQARAAFKQ